MKKNITKQTQNCKHKNNKPADLLLSELSPKDKKWDSIKSNSDNLSTFLLNSDDYQSWGRRMKNCCDVLFFNLILASGDNPENLYKLAMIYCCHLRHCLVCSKRRSLMYQAKFLKLLPALMEQYPKARFVFLTLTAPNVPIIELRPNMKLQSKAWHKFVQRKEFSLVKGWIRSTEVTKEKKRKGYAHPHFHCLLMVPPSWFKTNYTSQERWTRIWQECMGLNEKPIVDIRVVKGGAEKAMLETVKAFSYSVKPEELVADPDWTLEYFKQVEHLRFFAAGGVLKDAFKKIEQETDEDFVHFGDEPSEADLANAQKVAFDWRREEQKYRRWKDGDKLYDDYKKTPPLKT